MRRASRNRSKSTVLIATQGSAFKTQLVTEITGRLKPQSVYIRVVDVSALPGINDVEWNAAVLINTCEAEKIHADVKAYLDRAKDMKKIVLLTTSESGDWTPKDLPIDSISSASKKDRIATLAPQIAQQIEGLLAGIH